MIFHGQMGYDWPYHLQSLSSWRVQLPDVHTWPRTGQEKQGFNFAEARTWITYDSRYLGMFHAWRRWTSTIIHPGTRCISILFIFPWGTLGWLKVPSLHRGPVARFGVSGGRQRCDAMHSDPPGLGGSRCCAVEANIFGRRILELSEIWRTPNSNGWKPHVPI